MGDHVDEDMVRAALMADLGRLRQEELPLSDEAKRGPSFAPNNRNGTDEYTKHRKYQLSTKWGSKIEDDETRQMQGLEILDARPWARGRVAEALSTKTINSGPPPRFSPREPRKGGNPVVFNPPKQAWKDCVANMPKSSPSNTPIVAKRVPAQNQPAVPDESPAMMTQIKAEDSSGNATSTTPLTFTLHANELYSDALELVVGSGHCHVVPSKHEAVSFLCRVKLLINDKKGGVLALHSQVKGSQVHNVLDIDKPVMDDKYCVVKANSKEWPYYLRFGTLENSKKFRSCLSKLKKAALVHQEPARADPVTANPIASNAPIDAQGDAQGDVSVVSKTIFDAASLDTAADTSVLIPMEGNWQAPRNIRVSQLEPAVTKMVPLVQDILKRFMAEDSLRTGTIAGIEDAIFEKWIDEGWLKECNEEEREGSLALIRALVDMRLILSGEKRRDHQLVKSSLNQDGHRAEEKGTTDQQQQANGSDKQSERKATKGLSASCFAKTPFACANAFTGLQSRPPYK